MGEKISVLDAVIAVNILADIILRFRSAGVEVNLDNLAQKVAEKEAEKDRLNAELNG